MSAKKSDSSKSSRVRIAVTNISGELSFDCATTPTEMKDAIANALASGAALTLTDVKGTEFIVPADKIGYVEIGEPTERRVGFGAM